jgi:hypothetical protein
MHAMVAAKHLYLFTVALTNCYKIVYHRLRFIASIFLCFFLISLGVRAFFQLWQYTKFTDKIILFSDIHAQVLFTK